MVLGVDWLRRLGPITFNYSALTISFVHQGQHVVLVGKTLVALSICSSHLHWDISTNEICKLFLLHISLADSNNLLPYT